MAPLLFETRTLVPSSRKRREILVGNLYKKKEREKKKKKKKVEKKEEYVKRKTELASAPIELWMLWGKSHAMHTVFLQGKHTVHE